MILSARHCFAAVAACILSGCANTPSKVVKYPPLPPTVKSVPLAISRKSTSKATVIPTPLVPFASDANYQRNEPINPPWWVANNGQPSQLYYGTEPLSQETGTNDLGLLQAWAIQPTGSKIGIVDMTAHGDFVQAVARFAAPSSPIYRCEIYREYPDEVARGVRDCVDNGCQVITVTVGWPSPDEVMSNACVYAASRGVVIVCSTPNQDGDLDNGTVDYPYEWRMANVVGASSTERNGLHYSPSATGTNAIGAPGRNIVGNGVYSSGTSYAAPILAGCISLLMQRYPGQPPQTYIQALKNTAQGPARRVDPVAALLSLCGPPSLVATRTGVVIISSPGQTCTMQRSSDLKVWQDAPFNGSGFYRARVN